MGDQGRGARLSWRLARRLEVQRAPATRPDGRVYAASPPCCLGPPPPALRLHPPLPPCPAAQVQDCAAAGGAGAAAAQEEPHQVRWRCWVAAAGGGAWRISIAGTWLLPCLTATPRCLSPTALRYIPNVAAALFAVLETVAAQREDEPAGGTGDAGGCTLGLGGLSSWEVWHGVQWQWHCRTEQRSQGGMPHPPPSPKLPCYPACSQAAAVGARPCAGDRRTLWRGRLGHRPEQHRKQNWHVDANEAARHVMPLQPHTTTLRFLTRSLSMCGRACAPAQVVNGVRAGEVTEARLAAKLQEHVEQIDVDMVGAAGCCGLHSMPAPACFWLLVGCSSVGTDGHGQGGWRPQAVLPLRRTGPNEVRGVWAAPVLLLCPGQCWA